LTKLLKEILRKVLDSHRVRNCPTPDFKMTQSFLNLFVCGVRNVL
jgi:hypothetical protein